jgi:hypothetical protein
MESVKNFNEDTNFTLNELFYKLDEYLIGDIEKILEKGNIGYPCVMTILTGMELLGFLLSGDEKCAFNIFWNKLAQHNKIYKSNELRKIFRQVIRNGIAHDYFPKAGIYLHYDNPEKHLSMVENEKKALYVSCTALFQDFKELYDKIKKELILDEDKSYKNELQKKIEQGQGYIDKYFMSESFKKYNNKTITRDNLDNKVRQSIST